MGPAMLARMLVISRKVDQEVRIGDTIYRVVRTLPVNGFLLESREGDAFEVTDRRVTELAPDVKVSAGDRAHSQSVKLVIQAPRSIEVARL